MKAKLCKNGKPNHTSFILSLILLLNVFISNFGIQAQQKYFNFVPFFRYGGCDGNQNKFGTQDECKAVCVEPEGRDACYLPQVPGPCEGMI